MSQDNTVNGYVNSTEHHFEAVNTPNNDFDSDNEETEVCESDSEAYYSESSGSSSDSFEEGIICTMYHETGSSKLGD